MATKTQATVEDLYRVPGNGKAEIVNGEIVKVYRASEPDTKALAAWGDC